MRDDVWPILRRILSVIEWRLYMLKLILFLNTKSIAAGSDSLTTAFTIRYARSLSGRQENKMVLMVHTNRLQCINTYKTVKLKYTIKISKYPIILTKWYILYALCILSMPHIWGNYKHWWSCIRSTFSYMILPNHRICD